MGPSLLAHVLVLALLLGVTGPFLIDWSSSRLAGFILIGIIALLYFVIALLWACWHILFRPVNDKVPYGRQDDD